MLLWATPSDLERPKEELLHNLHMSKALARLQNKPYWIWEIDEHKQEDIKRVTYGTYKMEGGYTRRT